MAQKDMQNKTIFEQGNIVACTKMEVITIGLGRGRDIEDLTVLHKDTEDYKVFQHDDNGNIIVSTKEQPQGCVYSGDLTVVVRVLDGQVLIGGLYDLYCPPADKIAKLLGNPFKLEKLLNDEQLADLEPIFLASSKIIPSVAPAEPGRKVIQITSEMVGSGGTIKCHCPWDPAEVLTDLYEGDFFLVEDEALYKGYRIGREEFELTHKLD